MEGRRAGKEFVVCAQVHCEAALLGGFVYRKGGGGGLRCDTEHESISKELDEENVRRRAGTRSDKGVWWKGAGDAHGEPEISRCDRVSAVADPALQALQGGRGLLNRRRGVRVRGAQRLAGDLEDQLAEDGVLQGAQGPDFPQDPRECSQTPRLLSTPR